MQMWPSDELLDAQRAPSDRSELNKLAAEEVEHLNHSPLMGPLKSPIVVGGDGDDKSPAAAARALQVALGAKVGEMGAQVRHRHGR